MLKKMPNSGLTFVSDFKNLPDKERPRERLAKHGPQALSLWELVALIFRTGERHRGGHFEDVEQLSKRVISEAGFKGLFLQKDVFDVQENLFLQKRHAESIVTISEICRRMHGKYDIFDASEPAKIFEKFRSLQKVKQEQCHVLHLDKGKKCVYQELVAIGSGDSVQIYFTDVLRTPIWLGTKEIIVVHNHSGKCKASRDDISWTLALAKGTWELHQIKISDHVIIGRDGYFSFAEKNLL